PIEENSTFPEAICPQCRQIAEVPAAAPAANDPAENSPPTSESALSAPDSIFTTQAPSEAAPLDGPVSLAMDVPPDELQAPIKSAASSLGEQESGPALPLSFGPRPVSRGVRGSIFVVAVLIPLISYSILATIAVIVLYFRPEPPHPLEFLPDLEG